jgi:hypothetical protein
VGLSYSVVLLWQHVKYKLLGGLKDCPSKAHPVEAPGRPAVGRKTSGLLGGGLVRLLAVAVTGKGDGRNEGVGQSQALVKEGELLAEEGELGAG